MFEPGASLQYVTLGIVPWGAAVIGAVEARGGDDTAKNALRPPLVFTGDVSDLMSGIHRDARDDGASR